MKGWALRLPGSALIFSLSHFIPIKTYPPWVYRPQSLTSAFRDDQLTNPINKSKSMCQWEGLQCHPFPLLQISSLHFKSSLLKPDLPPRFSHPEEMVLVVRNSDLAEEEGREAVKDVEFSKEQVLGASCLPSPSSFDPKWKGNQEIIIPKNSYDKSKFSQDLNF